MHSLGAAYDMIRLHYYTGVIENHNVSLSCRLTLSPREMHEHGLYDVHSLCLSYSSNASRKSADSLHVCLSTFSYPSCYWI